MNARTGRLFQTALKLTRSVAGQGIIQMEEPQGPGHASFLDACMVVEDDSIIRLDLEETLRDFGFRNVHGASTLDAATHIAATAEIRFAVLDYELGRANTVELAETLVARGIPAVFLTGHGTGVELPAALAHLQVLSKPFSAELLAEALREAREAISAGSRAR